MRFNNACCFLLLSLKCLLFFYVLFLVSHDASVKMVFTKSEKTKTAEKIYIALRCHSSLIVAPSLSFVRFETKRERERERVWTKRKMRSFFLLKLMLHFVKIDGGMACHFSAGAKAGDEKGAK